MITFKTRILSNSKTRLIHHGDRFEESINQFSHYQCVWSGVIVIEPNSH